MALVARKFFVEDGGSFLWTRSRVWINCELQWHSRQGDMMSKKAETRSLGCWHCGVEAETDMC